MQLIVETETALDIERTMSTVEDIQNNKVDNLAFEDLNNKKCNGNNEIKKVNTTTNDEGSKQVISEIDQALVNIPMDVENNEVELVNEDLGEVISEQNSFKDNNGQIDESLNYSSENVTNGNLNVDPTDKQIIQEPDEEDYMEDDIISIREPFHIMSSTFTEIENVDSNNYASPIEEENQDSEKAEIIENTQESRMLIENSQNEDKDVIEVIEESNEAIVECEKEPDLPIQEGKDDIEIIEESESPTNQCMKRTELLTRQETDDIEIIEESQDSFDQCEKETEPPGKTQKNDVEIIEEVHDSAAKEVKRPELEKKDEIELNEESQDLTRCEKEESSQIQEEELNEESQDSTTCEKEEASQMQEEEKNEIGVIEELNENNLHNKMETDTLILVETNDRTVTPESKTEVPCENKNNFSGEEPKQEDNIDLIEEGDKIDSIKTTTDIIECNDTDHTIERDENVEAEIKADKKESSIAYKNEPALPLADKEYDESENITENTVSCENKIDTSVEKNVADQGIEENESNSAQLENKTESAAEINPAKIIENCMNDVTDLTETSERELVVEGTNTETVDSPIVLKDDVMDVDDIMKEETETNAEVVNSPVGLKDHMDVEEVVEKLNNNPAISVTASSSNVPVNKIIDNPIICKLSNTLDILSEDEEEEPPKVKTPDVVPSQEVSSKVADTEEKQCINLEDDDDIMLIDEESNKTEPNAPTATNNKEERPIVKRVENTDLETDEKTAQETDSLLDQNNPKETIPAAAAETQDYMKDIDIKEKIPETKIASPEPPKPLLPDNFVKTAKNKLADMTRDEIEEFCILKIVESIVDRSSLSEIKSKLKTMTQGLEEYRKKAMMLTKQNRDLQVVLKSVQEEQKKATADTPITPLKITRSVGMQVFMEKTTIAPRKKIQQQNGNNKAVNNSQNKNSPSQSPRPQKLANQSIPVPRLVPANNPTLKTPSTIPQINQMNTPNKNSNPPNGLLKNPTPGIKAEKRQYNKIGSSVTVDLTDDEPPTKMPGGPKSSPAPPVRLVPPQNLMAPQRQAFGTGVNSPRKVYIPISGPQNHALRPGQTIMLKTVPPPGLRPRCSVPQMTRIEPNPIKMNNRVGLRHPAPLPVLSKSYQPPNWKSLPPAPDLKLSKVENGIVISWKIEGVSEDSYEPIASYQLYAYQETAAPPNTALWKKIGDVKALPLPMACTLTQFMAGYKYYFAVRAIDNRSRFGPFSLPASILLLSKT